jgi:hypothetical protein
MLDAVVKPMSEEQWNIVTVSYLCLCDKVIVNTDQLCDVIN